MLVGELHADAATERVPDDRRPLDPQRKHEVAQQVGVGAEGVIVARFVGLPVAEKIGSDHRVVLPERREDLTPRRGAAGDAVDEHEDWTFGAGLGTTDPVGEAVTVQADDSLVRILHRSYLTAR